MFYMMGTAACCLASDKRHTCQAMGKQYSRRDSGDGASIPYTPDINAKDRDVYFLFRGLCLVRILVVLLRAVESCDKCHLLSRRWATWEISMDMLCEQIKQVDRRYASGIFGCLSLAAFV